MPNQQLTRWNRVEKKGTRCRPAGVIRSSGLEHQQVAGVSVGFGTARKWWKKHGSDKNLTEFYEISPNPVKISLDSMRFRKIWSKSHWIRWDFAKSSQNLTRSKGNSAEIWKNITGIWVFSPDFGKFWPKLEIFRLVRVLREDNQNPIRHNRFLVMKTRWSSWVGRFQVRSGRFFEWVGYSDEYEQLSVRTGVYYIVGGFMNFLLIKLKIQKILKL